MELFYYLLVVELQTIHKVIRILPNKTEIELKVSKKRNNCINIIENVQKALNLIHDQKLFSGSFNYKTIQRGRIC